LRGEIRMDYKNWQLRVMDEAKELEDKIIKLEIILKNKMSQTNY